MQDLLVYHVLPDRFRRAGQKSRLSNTPPTVSPVEFYGGSVRGLIEALPYIKSLGCGAVFIGPVFKNAPTCLLYLFEF